MMDNLDTLPSDSFNSDSDLPNISLDNLCEMCDFLPDGPEKIDCLNDCVQN
jgi:hypothetical protein